MTLDRGLGDQDISNVVPYASNEGKRFPFGTLVILIVERENRTSVRVCSRKAQPKTSRDVGEKEMDPTL